MNNQPLIHQEGGVNDGVFIVIEGTDGSGKGTQFKLLVDKLEQEGYKVASFDFPQYNNDSSYFVKQYLNGKYGSAEDTSPYTGSLFYALDRYEASFAINKALAEGKIVLCNRFTGSNMAHQGTKFIHPEERRGYFIWLDNLEFEMLKIPRPTKNFVLRVPAQIAQNLVDKKDARDYTTKKRDIHEANIEHMRKSVEVYDDLCQLFPKDFERIDCIRNDKLMSIDDIHKIIWEKVRPMLGNSNKDLLQKNDDEYIITSQGHKYLKDLLTSTKGNVYAFTDKLSPITIAAAMARLSRRGDDMRVTLLDEFTFKDNKDEGLLKRVITAYGDDSVQQLVGQHIVIENASNLLTKKIEWGRLASYLEQSTRYIYYDKKVNGKYKYFVPENLDQNTKKSYISIIDKIFDNYSNIVHKVTDYVRATDKTPKNERDVAWNGATRAQACDVARNLLPVATTSTVGVFASGQALEGLIMRLQADGLTESVKVGEQILKQARKVIPAFLERADKPERGGATIAYKSSVQSNVSKLAKKVITKQFSESFSDVSLTSYWPKNELDIVADMLYEHTNLALEEIKEQLDNTSYEQKLQIFNTYMGERLNRRHKPGRALEKVHYSWDLICDYGIFRDLQRHRIVDDLQWQPLSPRYGFEIPKLIEDAGLTDLFEQCFDLSLELYSLLQANGYEAEAQYTTLLGHKMRWKVTYNAREAFHLHELRTTPQGHPGYRKLVNTMHEQLKSVHPLIADAMIFVNKDEDPKLTRLAAERYTQFKLKQIDTNN
jgi:thymidylate kinase/thymidylate synthase ThyX